MKGGILLWLQETLNRLFIKQPKYFKYWTYLSYVLFAISGIPYLVNQFNITLVEPFASMSNKLITGASVIMFWMSKLVVKTPVVGSTTEGQAVQVTSQKDMPFTSRSEAKEIADKIPPIKTIPEVPEKKPQAKPKKKP